MPDETASRAHHTLRARSFDAVADQYAATRPGYPSALFDVLGELGGRPLDGSDVLDAGAGTGIATRLMRARGARVTALERGAGMAARLRAEAPRTPLVLADGNALPFAADSFDLVTYAQAFHWTDPRRSVPEALRVLRQGGALALWWNQLDPGVPWVAEQERRLDFFTRTLVTRESAEELLGPFGLTPAVRDVPWSRRLTVDEHLRNIGSHSHWVTQPDRGAAALAAERAELLARFPDGELDEPYVCALIVARRG